MKRYLIGMLLIMIPFTHAWSDDKNMFASKKFATPNSSIIVTDGKAGARICYYEDRAYSVGAVIQVGQVYLICQNQNDHELNGQLGWVAFNVEKP